MFRLFATGFWGRNTPARCAGNFQSALKEQSKSSGKELKMIQSPKPEAGRQRPNKKPGSFSLPQANQRQKKRISRLKLLPTVTVKQPPIFGPHFSTLSYVIPLFLRLYHNFHTLKSRFFKIPMEYWPFLPLNYPFSMPKNCTEIISPKAPRPVLWILSGILIERIKPAPMKSSSPPLFFACPLPNCFGSL